MDELELRPLVGGSAEVAAVQRVLEGAPGYFLLTQGAPARADEARRLFDELPPGRDYADKLVLGLFQRQVLIGCADLLRGWPNPTTAVIGLLLIVEGEQGRGLGRAAARELDAQARRWGCARLRLGVLRENERARRFWRAAGFLETGEVKAHAAGSISSDVLVMERPVPPSPG